MQSARREFVNSWSDRLTGIARALVQHAGG